MIRVCVVSGLCYQDDEGSSVSSAGGLLISSFRAETLGQNRGDPLSLDSVRANRFTERRLVYEQLFYHDIKQKRLSFPCIYSRIA